MNFVLRYTLPVYMGALTMLYLKAEGLSGFMLWGIFLGVATLNAFLILIRDKAISEQK